MPPGGEFHALGAIPLFHGLEHNELERIRAMFHPLTVAAGTNIMSLGQPGEAAYIIRGGTVKIHVEQLDGRDVVIALRGPGELVGELSVLDNIPRTASVVSLEPVSLLWIDRINFQECLRTIPALSLNLVHVLARRLRVATTQIQLLTTQDIYGRVAHLLVTLAAEYGEHLEDGAFHIPLRLTQNDLAGLAGASRARVNQVLVYYREQHYISVDAQYRITIHDKQALVDRYE